jgi:hypothetical protein|tara:strand:+ start:1446 stop:1739 length:294 start_codon:yes stop_codon:yes gene_type:complete
MKTLNFLIRNRHRSIPVEGNNMSENQTVNNETETPKKKNPESLQFPPDSGVRDKLKVLAKLLEEKQKKSTGFTGRVAMYTAARIAIEDMTERLSNEG